MAEIKIDKKKPVWPWVLAAIALLAAILYFVLNDPIASEDEAEVGQTTEQTSTYENNAGSINNPTVASYLQFVESNSVKMGLDHEYSSEALSKLMAATEAKANEIGFDAQDDLSKVKEYANKIATDPYETSHANSIRNAASLLTGTLQNMQQAEYPQLSSEVNELKEASDAIDPDALTLDQKEEVKTYFEKAAELLQKMN